MPSLVEPPSPGVRHAVQQTGPSSLPGAGDARHALRRADAGAGRGHPGRPGRPRPHRHRPDRHGQDRRLPAADPAPAARQAAQRRPRPWSSRRRASWPSRSTTCCWPWPTTRRCAAASSWAARRWGRRKRRCGPASSWSSPRRAGCSTTCGRTRRASTRSTRWCWTRPIACSTWASCRTSNGSSPACRRGSRRCCSPRRCRR